MDHYNHKNKKHEEHAEARWGATDAYKEYTEKSSVRSDAESKDIQDGLMQIFSVNLKLTLTATPAKAQRSLFQKLLKSIQNNNSNCSRFV